ARGLPAGAPAGSKTGGGTGLEPRHLHAARTRRKGRYVGSGKLNAITGFMATSFCTPRANQATPALGALSASRVSRSLARGPILFGCPGAERAVGRAEGRGTGQRLRDARQPLHRADAHRGLVISEAGQL